MESGEYPVPALERKPQAPYVRRRSVDNLVAVRPVVSLPVVSSPREGGSVFDDDPEDEVTAQIELDRQGPVSSPGSTGHRGGVRLVDAYDFNSMPPSGLLELQSRRPPERAALPPTPKLPRKLVEDDALRAIPPPPASTARGAAAAVATSDTRTVLAAFAGFGDPPQSVFSTPSYALRVFLRRRAMKRDLALALQHRKADVPLYEEALKSADAAAVRTGYAMMVVFVVAVFATTLGLVTFGGDLLGAAP